MDFRGTKLMDYVSAANYWAEIQKKNHNLRLKWARHYHPWLIEKYRELEKELDVFCEERLEKEKKSRGKEVKITVDKRSCRPFPRTTSDDYGWLAKRPEFQLEIYGKLQNPPTYPDPMASVVKVGGDIPTLAAGRGFYL